MKMAKLTYGHGTSCAEDDARFLLKSVLRIPGDSLELSSEYSRILTRDEFRLLDRAFFFRIQKYQPTPYIVGESWLGGLKFHVTPNVLIPRSFIMECLPRNPPTVEVTDCSRQLQAALSNTTIRTVADMGTGSGCLAVLLARSFPEARVFASDICKKALRIAKINVERHSLQSRIELHHSDLFLSPCFENVKFDLIVSNPPYVETSEIPKLPKEYKKEPKKALDGGGNDGLALVRRLLRAAPNFLSEHGVLLCEVGGRAGALHRSLPKQKLEWLNVSGGKKQVFLVQREWMIEK